MSRRAILERDETGLPAAPVINLCLDPLAPHRRSTFEAIPGERLIDWLTEHYPGGFGGPLVIHWNGARLDIADADRALEPGDVIHLLVQPGGPALGTTIVAALVQAAIAAVAAIAFTLIMGKPRRPRAQETAAPDPVYSIAAAQNAARVFDPIPVIYGRVVTVPDFASQPYTYFDGNDQFLALILVIGVGEFVLHEVQIGETPVSALESNAVEYWLIEPEDHGQEMGPIEALTGIMENVVTSPEVGDQELLPGAGTDDPVHEPQFHTFTAPSTISGITVPGPPGWTHLQVVGSISNDGDYTLASYAGGVATVVESTIVNEAPTAIPTTLSWFPPSSETTVGPFVTSKPGAAGDRLILDFVWPGGLYEADEETGELLNLTSDFTIEYQEIADDGTPIGGFVTAAYAVTAHSNTPIRRSYSINVSPGRYRVKVTRLSPEAANARQVNNFVWTALKFRLLPTEGPVYGPVTLLALRIRATNGIAGQASSRVRAEVTRKLPPMGTGALMPTTNPADAFCDVLTNSIYGGRRPLSEIDMLELERLVEHWDGRAHFNGAFVQRSTIWEALTIVLQTAGATPLPIGQVMSIAQDGAKALRTQLFSDANMQRGTLGIGYSFDKPGDNDGVEIEFRDPEAFNARYVTFPPGAVDPDRVALFGCTDEIAAGQFARLLWQKRQRLRKTASFETELEGLLARLGDRVAIATQLPRWGKAGVVARVSGLTLTLDDPPDWSGEGHFVLLRDEFGVPGEPIAVAPGAAPGEIVLAELPPFALYGTGTQEPTHYAFASSSELVRDFTITSIQQAGAARVSIEAIVYDPAAYAETLPWMEEPI